MNATCSRVVAVALLGLLGAACAVLAACEDESGVEGARVANAVSTGTVHDEALTSSEWPSEVISNVAGRVESIDAMAGHGPRRVEYSRDGRHATLRYEVGVASVVIEFRRGDRDKKTMRIGDLSVAATVEREPAELAEKIKHAIRLEAKLERVATVDGAMNLLPDAIRSQATVVFLGTWYSRRGAHNLLPHRTGVRGVWYREQGYQVVRVYKGVVQTDHVGVSTPDSGPAIEDQLLLIALRPNQQSEELLRDEDTRFSHLNALQPSEILAVVSP